MHPGASDHRHNRTPNRHSDADLTRKRDLAKLGMAVSLGTLVYTGLRGREAAGLHVGAGIALIGFSFWHYRLYQPARRRRRQG